MNPVVIIPVYNEEKHIQEVIQQTKKYITNIIVVDDGSNDDTFQKAKEKGITVLKHVVNLGKGSAAKTGCDYAYMHQFDPLILMDGDGQHDPENITEFLSQLNPAEIVFGSRQFGGNMPLVLRFGNLFINLVAKILYGVNIKDTQSGYRAFTKNAYKKIRWRSNDYSMESEMIANVGKHKLKYKEVPIKTIYSDNYKGTTIVDGMRIVLKMFWWKIN